MSGTQNLEQSNCELVIELSPSVAAANKINNNDYTSVPACPPNNNVVESPNKKETKRTWRKKFGGIFLALLSAMFFSLVACFVKLATTHHALSIAFWRNFGNVVPSIPLVLYYRYGRGQMIFDEVWPIFKNQNWTNVRGLAVRGLLGSTCVILKFLALDYLTIADSAVIMYGGPLFTITLGHFVLNEKCGLVPVLVSFWCLFGVFVISRPPFITGASEYDTGLLIGIGIVLIVVIFQGIVTVLVRKVRKIHFAVMTLYIGLWGLLQSAIVAVSFGKFSVPVELYDILLMTAIGLCAFFGQMSAILSLKFEEAGSVSLIRTSDVIFSFIFQSLILHMGADMFSVIGACIVLSGVIIIAFRKWLSLQSEKSQARNYLGFLLR